MKWIGVGPRFLVSLVAVVLVVGLTSWTMIQYGAGMEAQKNMLEQTQTYTKTRKKVDEAARANPNNDVDVAREWLLKRQNRAK